MKLIKQMKLRYKHIFLSVALLTGGCSKEAPFNIVTEEGEGQILKSALNVDLRDGELDQTIVRGTRGDIVYDDFKVTFTKDGASAPTSTYRYGDMPEIVTLDKGAYVATATYGENLDAEWENPYYVGRSDAFSIKPGEITDNVGEIVCRLENIKVSINFAPILTQEMDASSFVEVKVVSGDHDAKGLRFTKSEENRGSAGYFRYVEGVSLVATFNGLVEGVKVSETKSIAKVEKGNHYKITFKLHTQGGENQGDANVDMKVDASVTVTNVERNVDLEEDEILDDSERPTEGPETPGGPDNPQPPTPGGNPEIIGVAPIDIDAINEIDGSLPVGLKVTSSATGGFQEFKVVIDSPDLTPEELESVGLSDNLNLAETPEQFAVPLANFGFPINVKGKDEADIEISTMLLGMLKAVGAGHTHKFILTVTDANGTTEKTLQLHIN